VNSPWLKFYPSDWRADPALRMCSLSARGLWMEVLCLMHEAIPRGSLLVNGQPVTDKQLASLAGVSVRDVTNCLSQLESAGVFSREDNRTIYSRRMRRDEEKAERDKANGKGGGNPRLIEGVNPPDKAQIPEARNQKEDIAADAASNGNGKYHFESGLIRLTAKDFTKWEKAFSYLDLAAELTGLTKWAGEQGPENWFFAVSGALAKRNREEKIRREKPANGQLRLTPSGNPWPEGID
jgi:hypothetical protein